MDYLLFQLDIYLMFQFILKHLIFCPNSVSFSWKAWWWWWQWWCWWTYIKVCILRCRYSLNLVRFCGWKIRNWCFMYVYIVFMRHKQIFANYILTTLLISFNPTSQSFEVISNFLWNTYLVCIIIINNSFHFHK